MTDIRKTAMITGGSRGIGLAIARQLACDNYNLALLHTGASSNYESTFEELRSLGTEVLVVAGNVVCRDDRDRFVAETVARYGSIDVLVNNAGVGPLERCDLLEMSEQSFDHVIDINLRGTLFLTQKVALQMLKQPIKGKKRGVIINISSISADTASINRGEYCISKAGVSMLTSLFASRLSGEGILVNEVRPGVILTDMTKGVEARYSALIKEGAFPIARWGTPEDVAAAVSALVSDKFLYTTGSYIHVDGGFHIKRL